jgi:hypothetical protein
MIAPLILNLFCISICIGVFLILIAMYKKPRRPQKTQILCPRTKRVLMDFELLNGRCVACLNSARDQSDVTKCEKEIKEQVNGKG